MVRWFGVALRRFHKLDQDLLPMRGSCEEEIDAGTVGAGARLRVDGLLAEARAKNLCRTVNVLHFVLHLLNSFAEFLQEARNCAGSAVRFRGQDVQPDARLEVQLELHGVLIGRYIGQSGQTVRSSDHLKRRGLDGEADGWWARE